MILGRRVVVVMPAYNAATTLERTYREIPADVVDHIVVVDDGSDDATVAIAERLQLEVLRHPANCGYGANQKTCYRAALDRGADIVVMLHPDYQYSPRLVTAMASMIASGHYDAVLGSRILGGGALAGGMPLYKYAANRFLTLIQNLLQGSKLSEFHTGYRAYARELLAALPFDQSSDDFIFDNQILAQALYRGFRIGEVSCPTHYFPEASTLGFLRSCRYGWGVLAVSVGYRLAKMGLPVRLFGGDSAPSD